MEYRRESLSLPLNDTGFVLLLVLKVELGCICTSFNLCKDLDMENSVALVGGEPVKFFPSVFDLFGMSMLHTAVQ